MAQPLVDEGTAVPLFSFGYRDESGEIVRDPNFPDLPSWVEAYQIVRGEEPSGPQFEIWQALFNMAVTSSRRWSCRAARPTTSSPVRRGGTADAR